jgi:hypothetical protein
MRSKLNGDAYSRGAQGIRTSSSMIPAHSPCITPTEHLIMEVEDEIEALRYFTFVKEEQIAA